MLILGALAVLVRAVAAALRGVAIERSWSSRASSALAGVSNGLAAWLAAGVVGAWTPWLPLALLGLVFGLLERRFPHPSIRFLADLLLVGVAGVLSGPALSTQRTSVAAVALLAVGALLDPSLRGGGRRLCLGVTAIPVVLAAALLATCGQPMAHARGLVRITLQNGLPQLGITPLHLGDRVPLPGGAVAWLDLPAGPGPHPAILFFHGNNLAGAAQPAACALRRGLVGAGFLVLSVDHPGYGESLRPTVDGPVEAWSPLPAARAAVTWLRERRDVSSVFVAGHSLGVGDVLLLLGSGEPIDGAVLLGGSLLERGDRADYWYRRFVDDRGLTPADLSRERYDEIQALYYDTGALAEALPADHAPILFVDFGHEGDTVRDGREALFERIPGAKEQWLFERSTHYFTVLLTRSLLCGDTRPARWMGERIRQFVNAPGNS